MPEPVIITPPAVEPVTLDQAKLQCRVTWTTEDTLISGLVSAAREEAEARSGRTLVYTTFDWTLDHWPWMSPGGGYDAGARHLAMTVPGFGGGFGPYHPGTIVIPGAPLASVTSIAYYDQSNTLQTLDPAAYQVMPGTPGRIVPSYLRPWPIVRPWPGSIAVRFVAGYSADASLVPAAAKTAVLIMVCGWYENRAHIDKGRPRDVPNTVDWLLSSMTAGSYR